MGDNVPKHPRTFEIVRVSPKGWRTSSISWVQSYVFFVKLPNFKVKNTRFLLEI